MANKDKVKDKSIKSINDVIDSIDMRMNDIYSQTYHTSKSTISDFEKISSNLGTAIDDVLSRNTDLSGLPDISRLYNRTIRKNNEVTNDLINNGGMFGDQDVLQSVMSIYQENTYIQQQDDEIDTLCKYMPKLQEALNVKKENVLSADNFLKEFINLSSKNVSSDKEGTFNSRVDDLKLTYELEEKIEEIYDDVAKYGEYLLYCVPYNKAFSELLKRKGTMQNMITAVPVLESGKLSDMFSDDPDYSSHKDIQFENQPSMTINLRKSCILESAVNAHAKTEKILSEMKYGGLYESFINESKDETKKMDTVFDSDKLKFEPISKNKRATSVDGLITGETDNHQTKVSGCILRKLERKNTLFLAIDNVVLGYYYIENGNRQLESAGNFQSLMGPKSMKRLKEDKGDQLLRYMSYQISNHIDKNFINANQDLRKEIYMILKHNDQFNIIDNESLNLNITFIPAEDVIHFAFKKDPKTHRGISDLYNSILPAKLYTMITLCTSVGILTRGMDKRVYYVKQSVDTNVAKSLINVISQIKKGNFGIRQMESINNILNIVGQYNDYVIPVGPNGDPPINMEVMQGQTIELPKDLVDAWEEQAINSIGTPLELLQATKSIDYAVHYTMSNSKFLRTVFKRQSKFEPQISRMLTKIYNCEYNERDEVEFTLPAPTFLSMVNGNSLLANTKDYANTLADIEMYDATDEEKALFVRKICRFYLPSHTNVKKIDQFKEEIEVEIAARKDPDSTED